MAIFLGGARFRLAKSETGQVPDLIEHGDIHLLLRLPAMTIKVRNPPDFHSLVSASIHRIRNHLGPWQCAKHDGLDGNYSWLHYSY